MKSDKKLTSYINKEGKFLTKKVYQRYAQQAHREGITAEEKCNEYGWYKTWGGKSKIA